MLGFLLNRPPWYAIGPALGLIVVAVYATINQQLGVLGGVSAIVERTTGRASRLGWKAFFLAGVVGGGFLHGALSGSWGTHGYGWLSRSFTGGWVVLIPAILAGAGVLIGFGAKTAGGCTSGNGLAGCSLGAPACLTATATFFGTAIIGSFLLRWLGA